jgi:hypothetical protein
LPNFELFFQANFLFSAVINLEKYLYTLY